MKQDTWLMGQETEQLLTDWICSEAKDKKNKTAWRQYDKWRQIYRKKYTLQLSLPDILTSPVSIFQNILKTLFKK